jgi:hypothetical protein
MTMRPHQKPCDCDACVDALLAELERRVLELEILAAAAGLQRSDQPGPTVAGESWRAPTVPWWSWREYDRAQLRRLREVLRTIAAAEAIAARGKTDA